VLLLPQDPHECFTHSAAALDLADRLQTPIFVMTDLDIGMNQRLCKPFVWDDAKAYDTGKVMTAAELEAGKDFGRYTRMWMAMAFPGVPCRAPTRPRAVSSPVVRRAIRMRCIPSVAQITSTTWNGSFANSRPLPTWFPNRLLRNATQKTPFGVIYYGSTAPAMREALDVLEVDGIHVDAMRVQAFPFPQTVDAFIAAHEKVFVVEQNRDAQLRSMLINELDVDPARLIRVLHYDGTPITARFIGSAIRKNVETATSMASSNGRKELV
jgi:2-oxoglutarate ferredoxin oxidoreductase subunit alpha